MTVFGTALVFIVILSIVILAHEFGHLLAAKRAGIRVYELAMGMGPRLWFLLRNKTIYALNLFPIGGYVRIAGLDEESEEKDPARPEECFNAKSLPQRFMTIFCGPLFNLLLGFIIFAVIFSYFGRPQGVSNEIAAVNAGSVAERAGLKIEDKLVSINGQALPMEKMIDVIHTSQGKKLALTIDRGGKTISITAAPQYNPKLKIALLGFSPQALYVRENPFSSLYYAFMHTVELSVMILVILGALIIGKVSVTDLAGPLGIAQMTGQVASSGGFVAISQFTAFLSINLAIVNLIPLPALDGGRLFFILLSAIIRRPINPVIEAKIHQWGLIALLILLVLLTGNDFRRIFIH